jgi:hypothetical protein
MKTKRRPWVWLGLCLGAVVLAAAVFLLVFGGAIVNGYGKRRMERAMAKALPGFSLQIGKLEYTVGANCLVAQSVTLRTRNMTLKAGRITLTGVRWARLLWGKTALADVLAKAGLEAADLEMEFPRLRHGILCARLRASVPDSELIAEGTELRPLVGEEELFAAQPYRKTRFRAVLPECRVLGLAYAELLQKKSYRARSVQFSRPSLDALVNRDKPVKPFVKPPLMVHEMLAAIRKPLQIDSLRITDGNLRYCEREAPGAEQGVQTFAAVNISVENIANRGEASTVMALQAQSSFMDAGVLQVQMAIPVASPDFSLRYSGSLGAMDLTHLNAFLERAKHARIKSGNLKEASFEIEVTAGRARGHVRAIYDDLKIALLDKQTGSEKGWSNRAASFSLNTFKIRNSNAPDASGRMKEGTVEYTRQPQERFLKFAWRALRSGILDVISH